MRNRRPRTVREQRVRMPMPSLAGARAIEPAHQQLGFSRKRLRPITLRSGLSSPAWVVAERKYPYL